jgi:hypothetical protein
VLIDDHKGREAMAAKTDSARAWLMVAAAFLASFVVFGVIYSFGVFLKPMAAEFDANAVGAVFAGHVWIGVSGGGTSAARSERHWPDAASNLAGSSG